MNILDLALGRYRVNSLLCKPRVGFVSQELVALLRCVGFLRHRAVPCTRAFRIVGTVCLTRLTMAKRAFGANNPYITPPLPRAHVDMLIQLLPVFTIFRKEFIVCAVSLLEMIPLICKFDLYFWREF